MIEQILNYQSLDAKKIKLEKEIENNENKRQANLMIKFVKDASAKSVNLNKEAAKLTKELNKLKEVQKKGFAVVEKYSKQKLDKLSLDEISALEQRVGRASGQLKELETRLIEHSKKINNVLTDFETTKKKVMLARQKHKENKEAYDNFLKEQEPKLKDMEKELKGLEKDLNKELLTKYKGLRKDGIFPVVVILNGNNCGGCGVGLASGTLAKIKAEGQVQCENCRRIIYS